MPMMHLNDDYTYALWRFDEPTGSIAYDTAGRHDLHLSEMSGGLPATIVPGTYKQYSREFKRAGSTLHGAVLTSSTNILQSVFSSSWTLEFVARPAAYENSPFRGAMFFYGNGTAIANNQASASFAASFGTPSFISTTGFNYGWEREDNAAAIEVVNDAGTTKRGQTNVYLHTALVKTVTIPEVSASLSLYHDGILMRTSVVKDFLFAWGPQQDTFYVGYAPRSISTALVATTNHFSGTIEEIRLSNINRTELEIKNSVLRCYNNSIHSGNPILLSATFPAMSGALDKTRNLSRVRLNFSKHMSAVTLFTASNYSVNPNTAVISHVTGGFDQTYCDILLSNFNENTLYYVTASNLTDIDNNALLSGSNVVAVRGGFGVDSALISLSTASRRTAYHMRGKSGSSYVYWISYDAPDKVGLYAPTSGLTDIVIDNLYYDPA